MKNRKEYDAKWREKNRARINKQNKAWRETESGKLSCLSAQYRKKYGIDFDQYNALLITHNNACAICGKNETQNKKRLTVDHCHTTGNVRGILCYRCNTGIATFEDDEKLIQKAALYLTKARAILAKVSA